MMNGNIDIAVRNLAPGSMRGSKNSSSSLISMKMATRSTTTTFASKNEDDDDGPSPELMSALEPVAKDLIRALLANADGGSLSDVFLVSSDQTPVPACRFVLAARSPVLKRMLYGSFREAKSTSICMMGYSSHILHAVVHYCCFNTIHLPVLFQQQQESCGSTVTPTMGSNHNGGSSSSSSVESILHRLNEANTRQLVRLVQAADYLELPGLQQLADQYTRTVMTAHPPLACAVLDEADSGSDLALYAMQIIECRPYIALDRGEMPATITTTTTTTSSVSSCSAPNRSRGGGIESLGHDGVLELMKNPHVGVGELFLFYMLHRWYLHAIQPIATTTATTAGADGSPGNLECKNDTKQKQPPLSSSYPSSFFHQQQRALETAQQCARHLNLENIEPHELFRVPIQGCPFVSPDRIFEAVAKQALRASHDRIWSLRCRGRETLERILVEGAGTRDANGMYYRIEGLASGDLYSKREIACGQQNVYTLSCSIKADQFECRIFSSKVLTHEAVLTLQTIHATSASPSELLLAVDPTFQPVFQVLSATPPEPRPIAPIHAPFRRFHMLELSDGDRIMPGSLDTSLQGLVESGALPDNAVIKVLEFCLYQLDERLAAIHIRKLSVVNSSPGHRFGSPVRYCAVHEIEETNQPAGVNPRNMNSGHDGNAITSLGGLQNLYSCTYPMHSRAKDTKIPQAGWLVKDHGVEPSPRCTFIPAVKVATALPCNAVLILPVKKPPVAEMSVRTTKTADTSMASTMTMATNAISIDWTTSLPLTEEVDPLAAIVASEEENSDGDTEPPVE